MPRPSGQHEAPSAAQLQIESDSGAQPVHEGELSSFGTGAFLDFGTTLCQVQFRRLRL